MVEQHLLVPPAVGADNQDKVRHKLNHSPVEAQTNREASDVITARCRNISGVFQRPHFPDLFGQ